MPFYYDVANSVTSSATPGNTTLQAFGCTNSGIGGETSGLVGIYAASRFGTAGGAQLRVVTGTNTTNSASGGTLQTASPRNLRSPAATSIWQISPTNTNATQTQRLTIGFAQTGGMGGWVPVTPQDAIQLIVGHNTPADVNFYDLAASAAVTYDRTIEVAEGQ